MILHSRLCFNGVLNVELQAELACKGENHSFDSTLAMKIDNLMLSNPTKSKSPSSRTIPIYQTSSIPNPAPSTVQSNSELMQLGISKLSTEERSRRLIHNLCIYCGEAGHVNTVCPLISWRTTTATSRVSVDNLSPQLRNFSLSVSRLLLKMVLFISQRWLTRVCIELDSSRLHQKMWHPLTTLWSTTQS